MVVAGENWDAANEEAVKAAKEENTFLVHPFDQVDHQTWREKVELFVSRQPHGRVTPALWRR